MSNVALLKITLRPEEHAPESLEAARRELALRDVVHVDVDRAHEELRLGLSDEAASARKQLRIVCSVLAVVFALQYLAWAPAVGRLFAGASQLTFHASIIIVVGIVAPIALVLGWRQHKAGWILLVALLIRYVAPVFHVFFINRHSPPMVGHGDATDVVVAVGDNIGALLIVAIYAAPLAALCQRKVRDLFAVSTPLMFATIAAATLFGLVEWFVGW